MKVTTAEFIKNYGQLADQALTEPVTITENGRDHRVLISAGDYKRLVRRGRRAYRTHEAPGELVGAIAATEPPSRSRRG
jgi:prevent-host-death family protein